MATVALAAAPTALAGAPQPGPPPLVLVDPGPVREIPALPAPWSETPPAAVPVPASPALPAPLVAPQAPMPMMRPAELLSEGVIVAGPGRPVRLRSPYPVARVSEGRAWRPVAITSGGWLRFALDDVAVSFSDGYVVVRAPRSASMVSFTVTDAQGRGTAPYRQLFRPSAADRCEAWLRGLRRAQGVRDGRRARAMRALLLRRCAHPAGIPRETARR
ncbi:MAG: hypothetical protein AB7V42_02380 [Thermoleophilia bacterium]